MSFLWDGEMYSNVSDIQATIGNELLSKTKISESDFVLDAGCGAGNITIEIAEKASQGHIIGIDSSVSMIEKCQEMILKRNIRNVEFFVSDITEISYDSTFDLIFSNSVFHWIKESKKALELLLKALKPDGTISIQFPLLNENHPLINYTNRVIEKLNFNDVYSNWSFPWYVPAKHDYETLLAEVGFRDIVIEEVKRTYKFDSASHLCAFFDSVGLQIYLDILQNEQVELFRKTLIMLVTESSLEFSFERLFAFGKK